MGKADVLRAEKAHVPNVSEYGEARDLYGSLAFFRERQSYRQAADERPFLYRGYRRCSGAALFTRLSAGSAVLSAQQRAPFPYTVLADVPLPFPLMRRAVICWRRSGA